MNMKHISVILVSPENVDNIGAVARAIKNTGFSDLRLINPPRPWRTKGKKMAMAAADVLQNARVFHSLTEAVRDLHLIIGTTRRCSKGRGFFLPFSKAISKIRKDSGRLKIGIVFGRESKGLANQDIRFCDHLVMIPANPAYPSLNLAQAVMVMLFSLSLEKNTTSTTDPVERFLIKKEIEITLKRFEAALRALGYRKGGAELLPRVLRTMRSLMKRSGLLEAEAQMIKGLSRRIVEKVL